MRITRSCAVLTLALVAPALVAPVAVAAGPPAAALAASAAAAASPAGSPLTGAVVAGPGAAPAASADTPEVQLDEVAVPLAEAAPSDEAPLEVEGRDPDAAPPPPDATRVEGPVVETDGVQTVGLTWAEGTGDGALEAQVRYRSEGTWSSWLALDTDAGAPDVGTPDDTADRRDGTSSLWVGAADGVQVAFTVAPGADAPADVEVALLSSELTAPAVGSGSAGAQRGAAVPAAPVAAAATGPGVVSRAQWGARAPSCTPDTASSLVGAVVHHTAGPDYSSQAEAMAQLRNDQRYHMDSRGWCDLGYNVVVDKWGTIYEGRVGSLSAPVVGVHAGGFNTGTFGVSVLGTYTDVGFTPATVDAVARIIGWRLAAYGRAPNGVLDYTTGGGENSRFGAGTTVRLPVVFAHRDVAYTSCPGNAGYAAMGEIRNRAQAVVDGYGTSRLGGNLVRASGRPEIYLVTASTKHHVTDGTVLGALAPLGPVVVVGQVQVDQLASGVALGRFVRDRDGAIALVDRGRRHRVDSCAELAAWGRACAEYGAMALPDPMTSLLPFGEELTTAYVTPQSQYFLVDGGRRHEITDAQALAAWPVQSNGPAVPLDASVGASLPYGPPIVRTGTVVQDRTSGATVLLDRPDGIALPTAVANATRFPDGLPLRRLDSESMAQLTPPRATANGVLRGPDGRRVALTTTGARLLPGDAVPAEAGVETSAEVLAALSPAPAAARLFVRSVGAADVFLVEGATRRPVRTGALLDALAAPERPSVVFVGDAALRSLPLGGAILEPGSLVKASGADVYLVDGLRTLVRLPSFSLAAAVGVGTAWSTVPDTDLTGYTVAARPLSGLWRCGDEVLLGAGGRLWPVPASTLARDGDPATTLDASTCARPARSGTAWGEPVVVGTAGSADLWVLSGGLRRPIPSGAAWRVLTDRWDVATVPAESLAAVPTGPVAYGPGTLVKGQGDARVWLVDGLDRLVHLPSFELAAAAGIPQQIVEVPSARLEGLTRTADSLSALWTCGGAPRVAAGGALRLVPGGLLAADAAPATVLDGSTCRRLPVGGTWTQPVFVRTAQAGDLYLLQNGTRRPVATMARVYQLTGGAGPLVAVVPDARLRAVPTGSPA